MQTEAKALDQGGCNGSSITNHNHSYASS
jgi:hypothetical protein